MDRDGDQRVCGDLGGLLVLALDCVMKIKKFIIGNVVTVNQPGHYPYDGVIEGERGPWLYVRSNEDNLQRTPYKKWCKEIIK